MRAELNARIGRTRPAQIVDALVARRGHGARSRRVDHIGSIPVNVRTFFVGALLVAGALPLASHFVPLRASEHSDPPERAAAVAWPTHFRDQPLTQLPPGALEERFARRFPGAIARFTDGERVLSLPPRRRYGSRTIGPEVTKVWFARTAPTRRLAPPAWAASKCS